MSRWYAGIDIGGTFTDAVLVEVGGDGLHSAKELTTHQDPARGALEALRGSMEQASIGAGEIERVVHATTLATNLILERRGARVAFVTPVGFGDLLAIGSDRRGDAARYDLLYEREPPPVPRSRTLEVRERLAADGSVVTPLDEAAARAALEALAAREPIDAVAICLLHAHASPVHERALAAIVRQVLPDAHVAESAEIWPEYREYERATTTVMAAYVGPEVARYVGRLERALRELGFAGSFQIMQSNGGLMSAATARQRPIHLVESGPAAGVIAAAHFGRAIGAPDVISFDMGGTTAKAGLVRGGEPGVTGDFRVGGSASAGARRVQTGLPVKIPVIDLAEVGAGGGSIASVDAGGALSVGPRSAGSEPGPACYGRGGELPTVTDADVVLGYLDPGFLLGGRMRIEPARSEAAIREHVARPLGLDVDAAAAGIHEIANASMASAIRIVTVERGVDPRELSMVAFGGAGPVHAVRVASEYEIPAVIVPPRPGVSSALGLLVSDATADELRTRILDGDAVQPAGLDAIFAGLESRARARLQKEGIDAGAIELQRSAELRFRFQAHTLPVPVPARRLTPADIERAAGAFRDAYAGLYGVRPADPVQWVGYRVRATGRLGRYELRPQPRHTRGEPRPAARRAHFAELGGYVDTPVYARDELAPGFRCEGPAIVEEPTSTCVIPPGHAATVDAFGSLVIRPRARGSGALHGEPGYGRA